MITRAQEHPSRLKLVAAFAAVYFFWGATYLFIKFGVETIPPFLMAGARHIVAGALLLAWAHSRGAGRASLVQLGSALVLGTLLLFGGNGGVSWAEQHVPSGLAALLVASVPLWMALLDWLRPGGTRPGGRISAGLVLGFAGVLLLIGPGRLAGGERVEPVGAIVLLAASLSWATGSLLSRRLPQSHSLIQAIGLQSLAGGAVLLVSSAVAGEWAEFHFAQVSLKSALSLGFLVVFGSIVGFTSYIWLLHVTTAARATTYAYINPVVALAFGRLAASEPLPLRTLLAAAVIVAAVALIVSAPARRPERPAEEEPARAETADLGCATPAEERGT